MKNPNPVRIPEPLWQLAERRPSTWKLAGIYANKKGYHNTVNANKLLWPTNYSIRLALDVVSKNNNFGRAIDFTLTDAEMKRVTRLLKKSAENPKDDRLAAVREFYGTLDGVTVFGLTKKDEDGPWTGSSADETHLWHIHISFFTAFVNDWLMIEPVLSVLLGETWEEWTGGMAEGLPKFGDSGEVIRYWQQTHNFARVVVSPPSPEIAVDGQYGEQSAAAFRDFWVKRGGDPKSPYDGKYISGWLANQYNLSRSQRVAQHAVDKLREEILAMPISDVKLREYVGEWLNKNISTFGIKGTIQGKVTVSED
jgi:hypothetical protein